jgi:AraC-like DNA-binding protein
MSDNIQTSKKDVRQFHSIEEANLKRKATMLQRYGVEYLFQSPIIRKKARKKADETNLIKYGNAHPMHGNKKPALEVRRKSINTLSEVSGIYPKQHLSFRKNFGNMIRNIKLIQAQDRLKRTLTEQNYNNYLSKEYLLEQSKINSIETISNELGVSEYLIKEQFKKLNIPFTTHSERLEYIIGSEKMKQLSSIEWLQNESKKHSLNYLYDYFGLSKDMFKKYLKILGIPFNEAINKFSYLNRIEDQIGAEKFKQLNDVDWLRQQKKEKYMSEIAEYFGLSLDTFRQYMKKNNIRLYN